MIVSRSSGLPDARLVIVLFLGVGDAMPEWTEERNDRRCNLIEAEMDGTLTPAEKDELDDLQEQILAHRRKVAPLQMPSLFGELI